MDKSIVAKSIEYHGASMQVMVCVEEMGELLQAISKTVRFPAAGIYMVNLAEEMADVMVYLENLKQIYGITDEMLDEWIRQKQAREAERMQRGM